MQGILPDPRPSEEREMGVARRLEMPQEGGWGSCKRGRPGNGLTGEPLGRGGGGVEKGAATTPPPIS